MSPDTLSRIGPTSGREDACALSDRQHQFDQRVDKDRISPMGNPAPKFLRCRVCGKEKDVPVYKEHPDVPMA